MLINNKNVLYPFDFLYLISENIMGILLFLVIGNIIIVFLFSLGNQDFVCWAWSFYFKAMVLEYLLSSVYFAFQILVALVALLPAMCLCQLSMCVGGLSILPMVCCYHNHNPVSAFSGSVVPPKGKGYLCLLHSTSVKGQGYLAQLLQRQFPN